MLYGVGCVFFWNSFYQNIPTFQNSNDTLQYKPNNTNDTLVKNNFQNLTDTLQYELNNTIAMEHGNDVNGTL